MLVISDKAVIKDNTIYIYYSGNDWEWTSWPAQNLPPVTGSKPLRARRQCRMGLATLTLDRFTCLQTCDGESCGTVVTAPMMVRDAASAHLVVNVDGTAPGRSWLSVDLLDAATGEPLAGYAGDDSTAIIEDGLSVGVQWKAQQTLAGVKCDRIRLRFRFYGKAKLYSFHFDKYSPHAADERP